MIRSIGLALLAALTFMVSSAPAQKFVQSIGGGGYGPAPSGFSTFGAPIDDCDCPVESVQQYAIPQQTVVERQVIVQEVPVQTYVVANRSVGVQRGFAGGGCNVTSRGFSGQRRGFSGGRRRGFSQSIGSAGGGGGGININGKKVKIKRNNGL